MTTKEKRNALIAHYTDDDGVFHAFRAADDFTEVFYAFGGHDHPDGPRRFAELSFADGIALGAGGNCDGTARWLFANALLWGVFAFGGADDA